MRSSLTDLSPPEKRELDSLISENDPELFWSALLRWARRLQDHEKLETAAAVYAAVRDSDAEPEVQAKAEKSLAAIEGRGSIGGRVEFLLGRFTKDATNPSTILPMLAGSSVFQLGKGFALSRMLEATKPTWWMRGIHGKLASSAFAYGLEVPAFALSGRALRSCASANSQPGLGQEMAGAALTLGMLKLAGAASQILMAKALGMTPAPVVRFAISQGALFAGLGSAHALEESVGIRAKVDGATTVTDILSSMLSLGVGSRLSHRLLGERYLSRLQDLGLQIQQAKGDLNLPARFRLPRTLPELQKIRSSTTPLAMLGAGLGTLLSPATAQAAVGVPLVPSSLLGSAALPILVGAGAVLAVSPMVMGVFTKGKQSPYRLPAEVESSPPTKKVLLRDEHVSAVLELFDEVRGGFTRLVMKQEIYDIEAALEAWTRSQLGERGVESDPSIRHHFATLEGALADPVRSRRVLAILNQDGFPLQQRLKFQKLFQAKLERGDIAGILQEIRNSMRSLDSLENGEVAQFTKIAYLVDYLKHGPFSEPPPPSSPAQPQPRGWIDHSLNWLRRRFGINRP
ncbi:MAG TPA: hypothetical protein VFW62_02880 [bacterium]|nr:hypothetical protein [bacterium]